MEAEGVGDQPEAELVAGGGLALVEGAWIGSERAGLLIVATPSLEPSGQSASTSWW